MYSRISLARLHDTAAICTIINQAAEKYRGVIPPDCFHEPYMTAEALTADIAAGVEFWGHDRNGTLGGVMGIQEVQDRALIRHAYVLPDLQGCGVGSGLIRHIIERQSLPLLVGTWAGAAWAIAFYRKHGFAETSRAETEQLLARYWAIPARQSESSVVLKRT